MARNWYSEVIDILDKEGNFFQICREIAKKHPKMVVEAANKVSGKSWQQECKDIRDSQGLIYAIKFCRSVTGMGLKEAKEAIEAL